MNTQKIINDFQNIISPEYYSAITDNIQGGWTVNQSVPNNTYISADIDSSMKVYCDNEGSISLKELVHKVRELEKKIIELEGYEKMNLKDILDE